MSHYVIVYHKKISVKFKEICCNKSQVWMPLQGTIEASHLIPFFSETSQAANDVLSVQSCSRTAQVSNRTGDGLSPPLLPPTYPPSRARHCVYSPNYRGGAGWQASHHRIPAGPKGWEPCKHPPLSPECDSDVQLSKGEPSLAKSKGPKRDIKDMRGIGSAGTDSGLCLRSRSRELGASPKCHSRQSGIWTSTSTDSPI